MNNSGVDDITVAYATPAMTRPRTVFLTRSWLVWFAAAFFCGLSSVFVANDRQRFEQVFADFRVRVPPLQKTIIEIPGWAIIGVGAATVLLLLALQIKLRSKHTATLFHLFAITAWCLTILVYREVMWQSIHFLTQGMFGSPFNHLWP